MYDIHTEALFDFIYTGRVDLVAHDRVAVMLVLCR